MSTKNYLLESKKKRLSEISNSIKKKNELLREWNEKEAKNVILPAQKWEDGRRIVSSFSTWSYIIFAFSVITIIPLFFILPYTVFLFRGRKAMKDEIIKNINIINSTMPVPVDDETYDEMVSSREWERLSEDNILFKKDTHKIQTLIN